MCRNYIISILSYSHYSAFNFTFGFKLFFLLLSHQYLCFVTRSDFCIFRGTNFSSVLMLSLYRVCLHIKLDQSVQMRFTEPSCLSIPAGGTLKHILWPFINDIWHTVHPQFTENIQDFQVLYWTVMIFSEFTPCHGQVGSTSSFFG